MARLGDLEAQVGGRIATKVVNPDFLTMLCHSTTQSADLNVQQASMLIPLDSVEESYHDLDPRR